MALDLSVLLSSVGTITSLMEGSVKLVQTIRSGIVARNDEVKKQLTTSLTELKQNLDHVRELARMVEASDFCVASLGQPRMRQSRAGLMKVIEPI